MTDKRKKKTHIAALYPAPVLPFVPLSSVTENTVTGEKSTSGYCFFLFFFSELPFEVGGHFLPRVLNEPFVYVL